jgi:DNA-binding response OmpR family regulator
MGAHHRDPAPQVAGRAATSSSPTASTRSSVAFLRAPQKILSRDQLLESSRLHDDIYDRSIDVQILRLRRKVEESPNQPKLIARSAAPATT